MNIGVFPHIFSHGLICVRSTHSDHSAPLSDDGVSVDAGARKDEIETGKINSDSGTVLYISTRKQWMAHPQ